MVSFAGCFPASQVETPSWEMTMKYETGTFELRDNDMMMRELTSAETNEVAGGTGFASVSGQLVSGAGSSAFTTSGTGFSLSTTPTFAFGSITMNISASGPNVSASVASLTEVF
jgi:hypothetical protein